MEPRAAEFASAAACTASDTSDHALMSRYTSIGQWVYWLIVVDCVGGRL